MLICESANGNKQAYKVVGNLHLNLLLFRNEQTGQKQYICPEGGGTVLVTWVG